MKKKGVLHMTNIIILDDQESHINDIENQVRSLAIDDLHIRKYQNEEQFIKDIDNIPEYSIFLIDIVLSKNSGIEVAKFINTYIHGAIVIFISSYLDKVVDIYDAQHYYFIYKPELEKRLPIAFDKAMKNLKNFKETLSIDVKGKTVVLHSHDILYLERQRHTTTIIDNKQELKCSYKLDEMSNKLPSYFIRCHRSYIINAKKVIEQKREEFVLENHITIPISRSYQKQVEKLFQEFLMEHL